MRGPEKLLKTEGQWVTRMGKWFPGERVVFRGKDLHQELVHDMDWMGLYLYSITGRRFTDQQMKVLNALWTYTSFPDPRLWNNRVAALGGTVRTTPTLALTAAAAVSEAALYGQGPSVRAIDFFLRVKAALGKGVELVDFVQEELQRRGKIFGYGRPISGFDERIPHLMGLMKETATDRGEHVLLALEVENQLMKHKEGLRINIAGLGAALAADMGFSPREFHLYKIPTLLAGMPPCLLDSYQKPEGTFFPFRCDVVHYQGPERRRWEENTGLSP